MSTPALDAAAMAAAAKIIAAGTAGGSTGPSRTASPPVMTAVSAASVPVTSVTTPAPTVSSTAATPLTDQAENALTQLVKSSKMNRSRATTLAEKPEVQVLLDKELFLIQTDRRTKMNPIQQLQLVRALAQFFLERVDDGHRYAYFEAIFLGRTDDPTLHEYRLSIMYQLVSFCLQYPVLQYLNHVMGWLCQMKNEDSMKMYSDRLIDMVVDHFVRSSSEKCETYKHLLPLDESCAEFCALFVARAPLHAPLNPHMIKLIIRYCTVNMQFILRHLRDTPWLGNDYAEKVVPKLVEYVLIDEVDEGDADSLLSCICFFLFRWQLDVLSSGERKGPTKRIEVLDLLLSPSYRWTKRRACLLASAIQTSTRSEDLIRRQMRRLVVPPQFKAVIEQISLIDVKNDPQRFIDTITEMQLAYETVGN